MAEGYTVTIWRGRNQAPPQWMAGRRPAVGYAHSELSLPEVTRVRVYDIRRQCFIVDQRAAARPGPEERRRRGYWGIRVA